jgi:outer membrane receptor protein involved in Fe transport
VLSATRHLCWRTVLVFACAALPASADPAVADEPLASLSLEQLLQLRVYSPTKLSEPTERATGSVSLVTRSMIDSYGWLSLNEVLYTLPGFTPSADFERSTVAARGLYEPWGNSRLLLLVDGIPHNDPVTGTAYTWEITPLSIAESIEVVRGPSASLYGPNAMNGVVALHTMSPGQEPFVRGNLRVGTFGRRLYELIGGARAPLASLTLGFTWDEFQGESRPSYDLSGRRDEAGRLRQFSPAEDRNSAFFLGKLEGRGRLEGFGLQLHNQRWGYQSRLGYLLFAPDGPEALDESRQILTATYHTPSEDAVWRQEYVLRLQRHNYQWNVRLLPGDMLDSHPGGLTEALVYHLDDVFGRAQLSYVNPQWGWAVVGTEYSLLMYGGDESHYLNADLSGEPLNDFPPQLPGPVRAGPFLEGMKDRPLHRVGLYAEWVSPRFLDGMLSFTAGARYDNRFFWFVDVFTDRSERFIAFQQLSPRLTMLLKPMGRLTARATLGWAFRDPAADELFAFNSLLALGGAGRLNPESSNTYELGLAYQLTKALRAQATGFFLQAREQIGYSSESITRNLYSRDTTGVEMELLLGTGLGALGTLNGILNASYVRLLKETVSDPAFTSQGDRLTWAPGTTAKAGLSHVYKRLTVSLLGRYQGPVFRKDSDLINPEHRTLRPDVLPGWFTLDVTAGVRLSAELTLRLKGTNLLDAQAYLVKIQDAPFDYRIEGRRLWAALELRL